MQDFINATKNSHTSAIATGNLLVLYGTHRIFLISYPEKDEIKNLFKLE